MGQAKSRWYIINGLLMLASFALFRNVLGVGEDPRVCPTNFCLQAATFGLLLPYGRISWTQEKTEKHS